MTGGVVRATVEDVERLRRMPAALPAFLDGDVWAPPLREVTPKGVLGWLLKISPITIHEVDPDAVPPPGALLTPQRPILDLEKLWHPLHFLYTGTDSEGHEPACYLMNGGEELGDEDLGYTSIRALNHDQVARFAEFLDGLSREDLTRRFDIPPMARVRVVPKTWRPDTPAATTLLESLLVAHDELRAFMTETRRGGQLAICYLT